MNLGPSSLPSASIQQVTEAVLTPSRVQHWSGERRLSRFRLLVAKHESRPRGLMTGRIHHTVTGAVYSDRQLVPSSQRDAFEDVRPTDRPTLARLPKTIERLAGIWLYGGHWMGHFGHFLLETLSTLWPEPDSSFAGLVFHRWPTERGAPVRLDWQDWLVDRVGWNVPIHIVEDRAALVQDLRVPTRAYRLHRGALPEAVSVWDRVAPLVDANDKVFLSRSRLPANQRSLPNDGELDDRLRALGCTVVHPQELSIEEQVRTVSRASTLIGVSGSQLHLSIFARSCTRIIEIGDPRLPDAPVADQVLIANARGQAHHFVPLLRAGTARDAGATAECVEAIGL